MNSDDYGVVVALNTYEDAVGFKGLEGPANDAADFIDWLTSPTGGEVPDANVTPHVLLSKPDASYPTVGDIGRVLRTLFTRSRPLDQPIGRRLYVFLAGHGFTTSSALALLHSVESRRSAPACVSGTQWLDCFYYRALFDELVLFMDCCRDYEATYESPGLPCLREIVRDSQHVKRLYLLAAGMGQKAFERPVNGKVRGLFSEALTAALRGGAVDGDGRITARGLVETVRRSMAPHAAAGLNQFPEPICSQDFVLFDGLSPRCCRVVAACPPGTFTVQLFRGDDPRRERPILPVAVEEVRHLFDVPRDKTYLAIMGSEEGTVRGVGAFSSSSDLVEIALEATL